MGIFDRTSVEWPEDLKEFKDKKPEELARAVREAAAKNAKLEQDLIDSRTQVSAIQTEFQTIKDQLKNMQVTPTTVTVPQTQHPTLTSWDDDPDKAFSERTQPLVTGMLLANAKSARLVAERLMLDDPKMAYMLREHRSDVEKAFSTIPLPQQTDSNSYLWTIKALIGDKFDSLNKVFNDNKGSFFAETSTDTSGGGFHQQKTTGNEVTLDDKDREVARKSGLTEAQFLASKKKILNQFATM